MCPSCVKSLVFKTYFLGLCSLELTRHQITQQRDRLGFGFRARGILEGGRDEFLGLPALTFLRSLSPLCSEQNPRFAHISPSRGVAASSFERKPKSKPKTTRCETTGSPGWTTLPVYRSPTLGHPSKNPHAGRPATSRRRTPHTPILRVDTRPDRGVGQAVHGQLSAILTGRHEGGNPAGVQQVLCVVRPRSNEKVGPAGGSGEVEVVEVEWVGVVESVGPTHLFFPCGLSGRIWNENERTN